MSGQCYEHIRAGENRAQHARVATEAGAGRDRDPLRLTTEHQANRGAGMDRERDDRIPR